MYILRAIGGCSNANTNCIQGRDKNSMCKTGREEDEFYLSPPASHHCRDEHA